ncbi:MAG: hypothetical protein [Circular genetic element sp.]|jgi:hypothetical protein|nr:MAG: hypothetical protein [Circular genetic element sp.]|tara:strand:- start:456 stop:1115 length:660 start_codon:yes stop_codon:yes gene_type:complete
MVSLKTLFTLGIIGAGLLAFTSLGGAGGIGQRIGGGFKAFQDNLVGGFTGTLNPFGAAAEPSEPRINLELSSDPSMYTDPATVERNLQNARDMNTGNPIGTSPQLPDPYDSSTVGGQVDTSPTPQATPIETTNEPQVKSGIPNQGLPSSYNSNPGSYLQRITQYVNRPYQNVNDQSQVAKLHNARAKSNYGGYGSERQQNAQLASLIATNAKKYSEYFS